MKFLCLHGAGTNDEIFDLQSGGIRHSLEEKGHTFRFINGGVLSDPEPEIASIMDGPFYKHYTVNTPPGPTLSTALQYTLSIIEKEGPFDAVMGFSQGAALACSLLIHHAKTHPDESPLFKMAVFICGATVWDVDNGLEALQPTPGTSAVGIPTVHIVGKQDPLYAEGKKLYGLCEPEKAVFYDHGSRHMIPFDLVNTERMAGIVEETVKQVEGL
ncbi:uncharacterized protein ACHE_50869S [Aspergillus chevalieri]|uniref:Serine hydrolase domain-containing protein n=1 Tax=Aspergillus chevalieri TaxID=182096 RepID=A0A7R7VS38_ASPCH|nr:uncharacterized protein ACHE_50869S [Aspergillus chevalieri]BCR89671.1 hypothetical protein ACHE_50869S [Aspergillus chevalieri]